MFWADRIAKEIRETRKPRNGETFVIRDEKTLSGRVHVGSMRSVAVHGLVSEALNGEGSESIFKYELNDFDPFDSVPGYLPLEKFREHLGKPLYRVPAPEGGAKNYAEFYAADFLKAHEKAGFAAEYYRATELYRSGKMDPLIKTALERAHDIRKILKEVSGSEKEEGWLPISVVCEKCGKMMTTRPYDFDGETVAYACDRAPEGCVPCGHTGRVAPWGGAAKLFWKIDWAAKWIAVGVDVEGGGKDHSTKGGARDVSNHIAREIFNFEPPFDTPYEFFLIGGKKMSSSKGSGSSAEEMSELFPSEVFRLLLIGKDIHEQINVDPAGESVPRLYDWYDELAQAARKEKHDDYARLYELCQLPGNRKPVRDLDIGPIAGYTAIKIDLTDFYAPRQMRFRDVAFIIQMPHLNLEKEAEAAKGSELSDLEHIKLAERAGYARFWLTTYAPGEFKYELQKSMPRVELSPEQKKALSLLADFIRTPRSGEEIHHRLHELKGEAPIEPAELFKAIYRIFLNRDSGPKAGWFLAGLDHSFVLKRLHDAANL